MRRDKKQAERQIIKTCWGTVFIVALAWLVLSPFPSLRIVVVCTVFGCGFLRLAYLGIKTGVMPYRLGPVYRDEERIYFWLLFYSEIVTGIAIIWFGFWVS